MEAYESINSLDEDSQSQRSETSFWQPWTLRRPVLLATLALSAVLLSVIIILQHINSRYGGLMFVPLNSVFSFISTFQFRYLPTLIIVVFGIWVAWIDLDVRRLEPWFQLSEEHQRSGDAQLDHRYDFDFILVVLVRSMRARHWTVFSSAFLLLVTTVLAPAVLTAMFITTPLAFRSDEECVKSSGLLSPSDQGKNMTHAFQWQVHNTLWLGQDLPSFTTRDSAFVPVWLERGYLPQAQSVTVSSLRYWSDLECWSPTTIYVGTIPSGANHTKPAAFLSDDRGNSVIYPADTGKAFQVYGSELYAAVFSAVSGRNNTWFASFAELSAWVPDFSPNGNATALFCSTAYYSEPILAEISSQGQVLSYESTGVQSVLTDAAFNRSFFEDLMSFPTGLVRDMNIDLDIPNEAIAQQESQIRALRIVPVNRTMSVGFALGSMQVDEREYFSPDVLAQAYSKAQKISFAFAIQQEFTRDDTSVENCFVTSVYEAVRLVPLFTGLTEAFLVIVVLSCSLLAINMWRRPLHLRHDVNSIAALMLLARSLHAQDATMLSKPALEERASVGIGMGTNSLISHPSRLVIKRQFSANIEAQSFRNSLARQHDLHNHELINKKNSTKFPLEMRRICILSVGALTIVMLIVLSLLQIKSRSRNGISPPSSNDVVRQIVLKFLPTIFATALSAYFAVLCRSYSLLVPYTDLKYGKGRARNTLLASYTSIPSPLVFFKAFTNRSYLLGGLSFTTIVSHLLTIALAGIFSVQTTFMVTEQDLHSVYNPNVLQPYNWNALSEGLSDALNIVVSNLTNDILLPTWTTHDFAYLPLTSKFANTTYDRAELDVLGYGIDAQCHNVVAPSTSAVEGYVDLTSAGRLAHIRVNMTTNDGTFIRCGWGDSDNSTQLTGDLQSYPQKAEISSVVWGPKNGTDHERELCSRMVLVGWLRANLRNDSAINFDNRTGHTKNNADFDYNATVIVCEPILRTQQSRLTIDSLGNILSAIPLGQPSYNPPSTANFSASLNNTARALGPGWGEWHDDLVARNWPSYYHKLHNQDTSFLNANESVISYDQAASMTTELMQRVFATQVALDRPFMQFINGTVAEEGNSAPASSDQIIGSAAESIPAQLYFSASRVLLSEAMLRIAQVILAFDSFVLVVLALTLPEPFLNGMPDTIAAQIALFAQSYAVDDAVTAAEAGCLAKLRNSEMRYGFGQFVGKDGKVNRGICRREDLIAEEGGTEVEMLSKDCKANTWTSMIGGRTSDEEIMLYKTAEVNIDEVK